MNPSENIAMGWQHSPGSERLEPLFQNQVQLWAHCPRAMLDIGNLDELSHQMRSL